MVVFQGKGTLALSYSVVSIAANSVPYTLAVPVS